jgi:hypothetical protein
MFYSIRHVTRFRYFAPVRESVMELRMQPRSEGRRRLRFPDRHQSARPALCLYRSSRQRGLSFQRAARMKSCASRRRPWSSAAAPPISGRRCARMGALQPLQSFGEHFDLLEPSKFAHMSARCRPFHERRTGLQSRTAIALTALKR